MAIDFPSSPTVGQQYTFNGVTYTYTAQGVWAGATGPNTPASVAPLMDGTAAVGTTVKFAREDHIHPSDTSRVVKAGDTMTGGLMITYDGATLNLNTTGAGASNLVFSKSGSTRWFWQTGNAESTGNIGSDLFFSAYGAGGYIGSPVSINRATGNVSIPTTTASTSNTTGALTVGGGIGAAGNIYASAAIGIGDTGIPTGIVGNGTNIAIRTYSGSGAIYFETASSGAALGNWDSTRLAAAGAIIVGAPTGGAKGVGTINATAVYDDNVLLTCVGVQYLVHGEVDLAQWDSLSPVKHHKTAHRFAELVKAFDPRDPKQYIKRMFEDEALPGMPTMDGWRHGDMSLGEMHNRLWLATELLASAFVGLHNDYEDRLASLTQRIEVLEKGRI